ncbi:hypothetical protein GF386_05130 [Candidatus Pacearchaeota archaeon]|nr:hypothetical protein [Candidatus Pacearchaeota archaeon]MBD3283494.1 hypothetical protein [Candidatus Pacearchaeota archaeon]
MGVEGKTEKREVDDGREVTVAVNQLTQEEAREMYPYRPLNKYSESRFGGNEIMDDTALLLNRNARRCRMCKAPTIYRYLIEDTCPDCDVRSEYNGADPRDPNYHELCEHVA